MKKNIQKGFSLILSLMLGFLFSVFAQTPKTVVIAPVKIATRILTADELYMSQGSFILRINKDYRYLTVNPNAALEVGSITNLWQYINDPAKQTWQFIVKDGGFYKIKSASGFFLTQKRVLVPSLDPETNEDSQLWQITELPDGFYTIMSKTNKYIVASDTRNRDGAIVSFANAVTGADNQKWQLIKWTNDGRRTTTFDPSTMGFHFANTFAGIDASYRYGGLCGGMVYSAMDYYRTRKTLPSQTYKPANRTPLQSFIFGRQNDAAIGNQLDKWTELRVNPFGWRDAEFFEWGLQGYGGGRWEELKQLIDAGNPAPLGLYEGGTTDYNGRKSGDHQVLAVAYAAGRYKGDKGAHIQDMKIIIYNPNFPNWIMTLAPDISRKCFFEVEAGETWRTYFVDKKYSPKIPPDINSLAANEPDGSIRHLYATFKTGSDDLRGGSDNVHLTINYNDGSSQTFQNVNGLARWVDNYEETVPLTLDRAISRSMIQSIRLTTTFGGGIGGDNWNLDSFCLTNGGDITIVCVNQQNEDPKPLFRFTGDQKIFTIPVR